MNISAHYKKANIVNLAFGLFFVIAAFFVPITDVIFWTSLAAIIIIPRLILRLSKDDKIKFREQRRSVLRSKPALLYRILFFSRILPLILGFAAYNLLSFSYDQSAFIFIGSMMLFAIMNNLKMRPLYENELAKTFD